MLHHGVFSLCTTHLCVSPPDHQFASCHSPCVVMETTLALYLVFFACIFLSVGCLSEVSWGHFPPTTATTILVVPCATFMCFWCGCGREYVTVHAFLDEFESASSLSSSARFVIFTLHPSSSLPLFLFLLRHSTTLLRSLALLLLFFFLFLPL